METFCTDLLVCFESDEFGTDAMFCLTTIKKTLLTLALPNQQESFSTDTIQVCPLSSVLRTSSRTLHCRIGEVTRVVTNSK